ncbi:MAG: 4Fe-4S binding protein [Candidatus Theseobacter exili]|nr:4Fe-4S binding protein [Candidatus Theseobacter exili]
MKRQIINIDEQKCNGCGLCVPDCPEGALQVIDGKARLVGELLCDGLGACIGNCPENAISVEEREAEPYEEEKVMENIVKAGDRVLAAHIKHLKDHNQQEYIATAMDFLKRNNMSVPAEESTKPPVHSGCPGTMMKDFRTAEKAQTVQDQFINADSELKQWPIQLQLLSPLAPYFDNADLVIAADCVPFAYADFHKRFLKDKILIIFCPKLDIVMELYLQKLTSILRDNNIKSLTMLHMEVPCCYGVVKLIKEAIKQSGKSLILKDYTISIQGKII